jgi:hypothetical protein
MQAQKITELKILKGDTKTIGKALNQGKNQEEAIKIIEKVVLSTNGLNREHLFSVLYCFKKVHTAWTNAKNGFEIDKEFSQVYTGVLMKIHDSCVKLNKNLEYTEKSIVRALCAFTRTTMKQVYLDYQVKLINSKCLSYIYGYETLLDIADRCFADMKDGKGTYRRGISYYVFLDSINPTLVNMNLEEFRTLREHLERVADYLEIRKPEEGETLSQYLKGFQPKYNEWFITRFSKGSSIDYRF